MGKVKVDRFSSVFGIAVGILILIILVIFFMTRNQPSELAVTKSIVFGSPINEVDSKIYPASIISYGKSSAIEYNLPKGVSLIAPFSGMAKISRPSNSSSLFPDGVSVSFLDKDGLNVIYVFRYSELDLSKDEFEVSIGEPIGKVGNKLGKQISANNPGLIVLVGNNKKSVNYDILTDEAGFRVDEIK